MASDPEPGRSESVARTTQARAESRALRKQVADAAEEVARVQYLSGKPMATILG